MIAWVLLVLAIIAGSRGKPDGPEPAMTIGRLHYDGGGDWYANPSSLPNLLTALRTRTGLRVSTQERVVTLSDDDLWNVPYIYMTGHGNVHWSDPDLATLRRYLLQGGFLHADDNYGMDQSIRRELARLFPDHPLVEVPLDHPIYHLIYDLPKGIPKIHVHDGKPAQGFGIFEQNTCTMAETHAPFQRSSTKILSSATGPALSMTRALGSGGGPPRNHGFTSPRIRTARPGPGNGCR